MVGQESVVGGIGRSRRCSGEVHPDQSVVIFEDGIDDVTLYR